MISDGANVIIHQECYESSPGDADDRCRPHAERPLSRNTVTHPSSLKPRRDNPDFVNRLRYSYGSQETLAVKKLRRGRAPW